MSAVNILVRLLVDPQTATDVAADEWPAIVSVARAEVMLGSLAYRLKDQSLPAAVAVTMDEARDAADIGQRAALWEAEMARRAMADVPFVLMKGTAYAAASLSPAPGRQIGDLDIMVARDDLAEAEARLLGAGWEWVKDDPYDHAYYRQWMHELPPMIHRERDRMIDVHHTILPLTAKPKPHAERMMTRGMNLGNGLCVFHPIDRIIHAATHLFADGDLQGGLRNLWDINGMIREGGFDADQLRQDAQQDGLFPAVERAMRLAHRIYAAPMPWPSNPHLSDGLFVRRMLARDDWGREARKPLRSAFYIRSHWLRMPPMMLARHLWVKWRKG